MPRSSFSNVTDQVADLLRNGMLSVRWTGTLPGRDQLAGELGVSHTTREAAMRRLAKEGVLVSQGTGKRRRIVLPAGDGASIPRHFKVRIHLYELLDGNSSSLGTSWTLSEEKESSPAQAAALRQRDAGSGLSPAGAGSVFHRAQACEQGA